MNRGSNREGPAQEVHLILETEQKGTINFHVKRSVLAQEMSEQAAAGIQDRYEIPSKCANANVLTNFESYLFSRSMVIYQQSRHDTQLLIGTMRLTDFLGLTIFQQAFITDVVIPSLNVGNCIVFLEETHKKLKNQQNGSQCWYSLLNACITFLSLNLSEVYYRSEDKIKGLHEKILNEVLDRAIRHGSTSNNGKDPKDEVRIFELIMKSRKANNAHSLCEILRKSIMSKKINAKIHAKLSWKLQDVATITEKKTKGFKFLEYDWMLSAVRSPNSQLQVSLIFAGFNRVDIGAFYIKLMWWIDGKQDQKREQEMKINYILMNQKHELKVLTLTEEMQKELGKSKIQLSIFCCMDQIYTFTLNYIAKNSQNISLEEKSLAPEELEILAKLFQAKKQYAISIRYLKCLSGLTPNLPMDLVNSYPTKELGTYDLDFIERIKMQRNLGTSDASSRNLAPSQPSSRYFNNPSELSQVNSVSHFSRRSQQRPQSKGRLRKIFASSPSRSIGQSGGSVRLQQINRVTNVKNYFFDRNSPFFYQL